MLTYIWIYMHVHELLQYKFWNNIFIPIQLFCLNFSRQNIMIVENQCQYNVNDFLSMPSFWKSSCSLHLLWQTAFSENLQIKIYLIRKYWDLILNKSKLTMTIPSSLKANVLEVCWVLFVITRVPSTIAATHCEIVKVKVDIKLRKWKWRQMSLKFSEPCLWSGIVCWKTIQTNSKLWLLA